MKSIGIIILCRYNSSRLPGKILMPINNKPIIEYIIERLQQVVNREQIVIATSNQNTDDPIAEYCFNNNITFYRGCLENVSERFLNCGLSFNFDYICRINGDNLFVDIDTLRTMIDVTNNNSYNFISNIKNRTFPKGMSIEIVKTDFYKDAYLTFSTPEDFEHVTWNLYQIPEDNYYYVYNTVCPQFAGKQLAIDTLEDFKRAEYILQNFKEHHTKYGIQHIFNLYEQSLNLNTDE